MALEDSSKLKDSTETHRPYHPERSNRIWCLSLSLWQRCLHRSVLDIIDPIGEDEKEEISELLEHL